MLVAHRARCLFCVDVPLGSGRCDTPHTALVTGLLSLIESFADAARDPLASIYASSCLLLRLLRVVLPVARALPYMAVPSPVGAIKRLLALLLLFSFLTGSSATFYHRRVHARTRVKTLPRRQDTTESIVPVLGLPGLGVTTVHPRLEIRELQRRPDQFNVYLLGLRRFQNTSQDDKLSYFQIAGVYNLDQVD